MPLKCENTRSFNLKLVSTESCSGSSNKWPKLVLLYAVKPERRGDEIARLNPGVDVVLWSSSRGRSDLGGGVLNGIQNPASVV